MKYEYSKYDPKQGSMDEARALLTKAAQNAMKNGDLPEKELPDFIVEVPGDVKNGDLASNIAMLGARVFGMPPRKIAEAIVKNAPSLKDSCFDRLEIAGPGFINIFMTANWFGGVLLFVDAEGADYGKTDFGAGKKVNVEFVSANPTGPMHLGNARGGALGDCLAESLKWAGFDATREFYINDAGNQIAKFGKSLSARYMQLFDESYTFPEDGYQGADIATLAKEFADINGEKYVTETDEARQQAIIDYALPKNIDALKADLAKYRINYDVWFKESELHKGAVADVLKILADRGATYEKDGAIWYKSMDYSVKYGANQNTRKGLDGEVTVENKDEVLVRANGIPTYFAADIAYHYNKFAVRGFDTAIDVWGADHHGHVARMKGAMDAVGLDGEKLDIVLMQFVRLMQDGKPVKMSKRTGKAITLSTLLDEVPIDSARFQFNMREPGSTMDFDLDVAVAEDTNNPVYYVQYAHARICSILKALAAEGIDCTKDAADSHFWLLTEDAEKELLRHIAGFPSEIISAAKSYDPARITRYTTELATLFHKFYNACRVKEADADLRDARIALCKGTKTTLCNALSILNVSAPEKM
jgi:arginyl-tRNA synthetase